MVKDFEGRARPRESGRRGVLDGCLPIQKMQIDDWDGVAWVGSGYWPLAKGHVSSGRCLFCRRCDARRDGFSKLRQRRKFLPVLRVPLALRALLRRSLLLDFGPHESEPGLMKRTVRFPWWTRVASQVAIALVGTASISYTAAAHRCPTRFCFPPDFGRAAASTQGLPPRGKLQRKRQR